LRKEVERGEEEGEKQAAPFSKILVPVDNSEHAIRAFDYAVRLSKLSAAEISIVHVIPPPVAGEEGVPAIQLTESMLLEGKELLDRLKTRAAKMHATEEKNAKIDYLLREGTPSKVIVATAKELTADLIVMGSSGTGGVKELLLGSVSHAVSNHAICPVLIVK
jgi:nucleotide-binding universal stress UspA family protein